MTTTPTQSALASRSTTLLSLGLSRREWDRSCARTTESKLAPKACGYGDGDDGGDSRGGDGDGGGGGDLDGGNKRGKR